jgi:hypothetical protein
MAAVMVAVGALAGLTAAASPVRESVLAPASPNQGTMTCSWEQFGSHSRSNAFAAGAYNPTAHRLITYGGMNSNEDVVNDVLQINFPDADPNNATFGTVAGASAKELFGAAGAHDGAGMAWFIGGADEQDGQGTDFVQSLDQTGASPVWNNNVSVGGAFQERVFAAAAFEPSGAVVVNGGAEGCTSAIPPEDAADDCVAGNFSGSNVMVIDQMTGAATWDRLTGGPDRRYGGTLVYDSMGDRILSFGGTDDGSRGKAGVMELDTSDADWRNWTWSNLQTTGTAPADRFLHAAAYDAANNMMVVYGGVRSNAFANNESALQDTFGLDLSQTPAVWRNLGASLASSSVGAVMTYDTATSKVVLQGGRRQASANSTGNAYVLNCQEVVPTATNTPRPGVTPPTPGGPDPTDPVIPTLDPTAGLAACDYLTGRVPVAAINDAVANAAAVYGYGMLCQPNVPPNPWNGLRNKLSLRNPAVPYHPVYNGLVWSCGCP